MQVIVSADRPSTVPSALSSTIQRRVVLRLADESDYLMLDTGIDVLNASSPPGRGVLDGHDLQVAVLGGVANVAEQAKAIDKFAVALRARGTCRRRRYAGFRRWFDAELPSADASGRTGW